MIQRIDLIILWGKKSENLWNRFSSVENQQQKEKLRIEKVCLSQSNLKACCLTNTITTISQMAHLVYAHETDPSPG